MQRSHYNRRNELDDAISEFEKANGILLGISNSSRRNTFIDQIISSLRRVEYVKLLTTMHIDPARDNPHHTLFDPIKSAARFGTLGRWDDAIWLAFIATHFGKHVTDGWKLAANVFGSFGAGPVWDVQTYGKNQAAFDRMLLGNRAALADARRSGRFSNHRQYQSKKPEIISNVFRTFYNWQRSAGSFSQLIQNTHRRVGQNPREVFHDLYGSLNSVFGFGRLAKFDFLTMLSKLDLAPIEAGSAYLIGSTGPFSGAKLLFFNSASHPISAAQLSPRVDALDNFLHTGKQVIEDSLCNWQKSPDKYIYFKG